MHDTPRLSRVAATLGIALLLTSCGDGPTDPATRKAGVRAVLGAGITDTIDTQPVQALVVEVRQSGGALAPAGTLVRFEPQLAEPSPTRVYYMPAISVCELTVPVCGSYGSYGGFGAPGQLLTQTTDAQGRVKVLVRLGPAAGRAVVRLTVPEFGLEDSATYTVLPGKPAAVRASTADTVLDVGATATLHGRVVDRYDNVRSEVPTFSAGSGSALTVDATSGTVTARDMGTQSVLMHYNALVDSTRVQVVPSGRLVVWANGESVVRLVNLNGTSERTVISGIASDYGAFPSFDATHQRVTMHDGSEPWGGTPSNVIVVDTTGSPTRTIGAGTGLSMILTTRQIADGSVLVVAQSTTDTAHDGYSLWRVAPDNSITFLDSLPGMVPTYGGADISHSGTRVAYVATTSIGPYELRLLNVADGSTTVLESNARSPRWSAQDDRVAYLVPISGSYYDYGYNGAVVIINADGTGRRALGTSSFSAGLAWSPDGTYIVGRASEGYSLRLLRVSDAATVVLRFPFGGSFHDYWQPDWR